MLSEPAVSALTGTIYSMDAAVDLVLAGVDALWPQASQAPQTWLSPSETFRLNRIRDPGRYREFVASRYLLRSLLSAHTGWDQGWRSWVLEAPENASPLVHACCIDGEGLHLNLSHSQGLLACVVFRHPVGVDLEVQRTEHRRSVDGLIEMVCSPQEQSHLARLVEEEERRIAFTQLWTLKESHFKWLGTGLDLSLLPKLCSRADIQPENAIQSSGCSLVGEWAGRRYDLSVCTGALPSEVNVRTLEGVDCLTPFFSRRWALMESR